MRKFKCQFNKHRKGQTYFERSITWDAVTLLLAICDDVKIQYKKNKNKATFIFHKNDVNTFCTVIGIPDYLARQIIPVDEWKEY